MKKADIKTILVPIDFSTLSVAPLETGKDLARRFGASIHLVHVHEFYYPPGLLAPILLSVAAYRDDAVTRRIRRLKIMAKRNGLAVQNCHFLSGVPTFKEICNLARQIAADLIVMPTHGYTGVAHFLGGSTAERVVQHSPCPVVVVRGNGKKPSQEIITWEVKRGINRMLVPLDFSEASFQALEYAIEFAENVAARLLIYHSVSLRESFTANGCGIYYPSALEDVARRDAENQMRTRVSPRAIRNPRPHCFADTGDCLARSGPGYRPDYHCDPWPNRLQALAYGQHRGTHRPSCATPGAGRALASRNQESQTNAPNISKTGIS